MGQLSFCFWILGVFSTLTPYFEIFIKLYTSNVICRKHKCLLFYSLQNIWTRNFDKFIQQNTNILPVSRSFSFKISILNKTKQLGEIIWSVVCAACCHMVLARFLGECSTINFTLRQHFNFVLMKWSLAHTFC